MYTNLLNVLVTAYRVYLHDQGIIFAVNQGFGKTDFYAGRNSSESDEIEVFNVSWGVGTIKILW